jgi:DNA polymerase-3 subunit delta
MIHLILGENAYKAEQELARIIREHEVAPERLDSALLSVNTLADIVRGGSLFSEKRLVILRQLSENKAVFEKLAEWASEVPSDTTLVLLESKLDKRTKAYKSLVKHAKVIACEPLTERDSYEAESWLAVLAKTQKVRLTTEQIGNMVTRAFVAGEKPAQRSIDQMQLAQAIKALRGTDEVTDDMIATVLPPAPGDTVFDLLDMAARRHATRVDVLLAELERTDDPHRTLALVMGQWAQLVSVALADGPSATVTVELGLHPFVAKKQQELARQFTPTQIKTLTALAANLDAGSKLSQFSPADGVYRFVHAIVAR